jgi:hypothetical protein
MTHDYLVPSLRDWLTRKQRETRRGRAELRLAERAAEWNARPDARCLPTLSEYLAVLAYTRGPARHTSQQTSKGGSSSQHAGLYELKNAPIGAFIFRR